MRVAALCLVRLALAAVLVVAAVYCLLCYVPFTNQNLIASDLIAWLPTFVRLSPLLYLLLAAAAVATIAPGLGVGRAPAAAILAGTGLTAVAVWWLLARPLAHAGMTPPTLLHIRVLLLPLTILALADIGDGVGALHRTAGGRSEPLRVAVAAAVAAAVIAGLFFACGALRAPARLLPPADWAPLAVTAILTQLLVAAAAVVMVLVARSAAALVGRLVVAVETLLLAVIVTAALAHLFVRVVFAPIAFEGAAAARLAAGLAATLVATVAGLAVRVAAAGDGGVSSGVDLLLSGLGLAPHTRRRWLLAALVAVLAAAVLAARAAATFDWDFLLQKLVVVAAWVVVAGLLYRLLGTPHARHDWTPLVALAAVAVLAGQQLLAARSSHTAGRPGGADPARAATTWRGWDPAFRLVHDAVTARPPQHDDLYDYLHRNTNISRARRTDPVELSLVPQLRPAPPPEPDIFIITIDSLRRDYVNPFNPAVTFTPHLAALAAGGVAFTNAFTHYGATGLAEPSIWVGGMMLHKQYIEPFGPMNTLAKLLKAEHYRVFLGADPVLDAIVPDWPAVTRLPDQGLNSDLCANLVVLEKRIDALPAGEGPVFAYLQPLNIHISSINREGKRVPEGVSYPGFYAPYAWRLERMDGCIGSFLDYLDSRGLADNSVVVVTSDHGDSLGEGGRWGHAYTITPEVLRVPLIIRLPERFRSTLQADPARIAFTTDITPTLYALLGQGPLINDERFGRPLFTATLDEQLPWLRSNYLVASSYGPVYGILSGTGHSLYIADAINYRDEVWDIPAEGAPVVRPPVAAETARAHELIHAKVAAIARLYHFDPDAR